LIKISEGNGRLKRKAINARVAIIKNVLGKSRIFMNLKYPHTFNPPSITTIIDKPKDKVESFGKSRKYGRHLKPLNPKP
jgi:hypothetical protein